MSEKRSPKSQAGPMQLVQKETREVPPSSRRTSPFGFGTWRLFPYTDNGLSFSRVSVSSEVTGWESLKPQITPILNGVAAKSYPEGDITEINIFIYDSFMVLDLLSDAIRSIGYAFFNIKNGIITESDTKLISPIREDMDKTTKIAASTFNPSAKRWAERNRPTQQINLRLEPTLLDQVNDAALEAGQTRQEWITRAIKRALEP